MSNYDGMGSTQLHPATENESPTSTSRLRTVRKALRAIGVKWVRRRDGLMHFYFSETPRRMPDGSYYRGAEHIGSYTSWSQALSCGQLMGYTEINNNTL